MTSIPQDTLRRFAAAALFALASVSVAEGAAPADTASRPAVPAGTVVGTIQGPEGALFPGSRTGAYGFVRRAEGATTYFRVNGRNTRAQRLDDAGRVVGTFEDLGGRMRDFVIPMPRGEAFVDVALDLDDDAVG